MLGKINVQSIWNVILIKYHTMNKNNVDMKVGTSENVRQNKFQNIQSTFYLKIGIGNDNTICLIETTDDIRTLHDCPSQMNENLLISNSKLMSYS